MSLYAVGFKKEGDGIKILARKEFGGGIKINSSEFDNEGFNTPFFKFKDEKGNDIVLAKKFLNNFINGRPPPPPGPPPYASPPYASPEIGEIKTLQGIAVEAVPVTAPIPIESHAQAQAQAQ